MEKGIRDHASLVYNNAETIIQLQTVHNLHENKIKIKGTIL